MPKTIEKPKQFVFTRNVVIEGKARVDGEVVTEADFPDGSFGPCVRMGHIREYVEPSADEGQQSAKSDGGQSQAN